MLAEGYASVSTRRVAAEAGLTPSLVHYYYRTTDDLLLAAYVRMAERAFERLSAELQSGDPLRALWAFYKEDNQTKLINEFMALANHRKSIRTSIADHVDRFRKLQTDALKRWLDGKLFDQKVCPPSVVNLILTAISRHLVTEQALGISTDHQQTVKFVEWSIRRAGLHAGQREPERKRS